MDNETQTPKLHEPVAIRWKCTDCSGTQQTSIKDGNFLVPACTHGNLTQRAYAKTFKRGTVLFDVDGSVEMVHPEPPRIYKAEEGRVWRHLVALLDAIGVVMADGRHSADFCKACEEVPHQAVTPCSCPCHAAWALRRKMEGEGKAA